jgi:hypothetical protein
MFQIPSDLISHSYYKIVNLTKKNSVSEFLESIKIHYFNYYESNLNYETLYEHILNLSILYFIITSQNCKYYYDLYGDYLFNKLINKKHFNNELLNLLFNKNIDYDIINLNVTQEQLISGYNKIIILNKDSNDPKDLLYFLVDKYAINQKININIPKNSKHYDIITINNNIKIILNLISNNTFIIVGYNIFYDFKINIKNIFIEKQVSFLNYFGKNILLNINDININSIHIIKNEGFRDNLNNKNNFYYIISVKYELPVEDILKIESKNNLEKEKEIDIDIFNPALNTIIKLVIDNKKLNYNEIIQILNLLNSNDLKEELLIETIKKIENEIINIENEIIHKDIYKKYKNHFINQLIFRLFEIKE